MGTESNALDVAMCHELLSRGSKSFSLASRFLPGTVQDDAAVVYAFFRLSDDAVDDLYGTHEALVVFRSRLDRIYAGDPCDHPVDRALSELVRRTQMPIAPWLYLFEGYAWDLDKREYQTLSDVVAYGVRVAGTVGLVMTWLFGERDQQVLSRAVDLGIAMQLTNIARDVGDDAKQGRLYLPREWLTGLDIQSWMADPKPHPVVQAATERLLRSAERYYRSADFGIDVLPLEVRGGVRGARALYAEIGTVIARRGFDSVSSRAVTSRKRKMLALGREWLRTRLTNRLGRYESGVEPTKESGSLIEAMVPYEHA